MGNSKSKQRVGDLGHEAPPVDIWSKIADGADTFTQDLMFKWMDFEMDVARKMALKEKDHTSVEGSLKLSNFTVSKLPEAGNYSLAVKVQDQTVQAKFSRQKKGDTIKWPNENTFDVRGKGVTVHFKLYTSDVWNIIPFASAEWHLTGQQLSGEKVTVQMTRPFYWLTDEKIAKVSFSFNYSPVKEQAPSNDRGFIYASYLPVLDPNVPLPALAKPDTAFTYQDDIMTLIMGGIAVTWMVTGAENTRKIVPLPITERVDDAEGDVFWTERRLNGDNPGFIQPNPAKSDQAPWDYQIEFDFTSFIDVATDLKSGVISPVYMCARFVLLEEGNKTKLHPHSIKYILSGKAPVVQMNDGSVKWRHAKNFYRSFEMNAQFTYTHVGVHFNVEQYCMAISRNLSETHPIWTLLYPHFKNVVTNNRKVVRPKPDGVVTEADSYTYDGQIKLLQARFSHFSYKTSPQRVLPKNLENNAFENTQEVMWDIITQYVDEFFEAHPDITIDPEIVAMSKDLQGHALNPAPAMTVATIEDLRQMCKYVIFQAIFYHAWVHWNNYDDIYPTLQYDTADGAAPTKEEANKLEDKSYMIQTFVEYVSPWLKQWPILDPELGGPARLQELLWQNARKINPGIQVATLIMAPNA